MCLATYPFVYPSIAHFMFSSNVLSSSLNQAICKLFFPKLKDMHFQIKRAHWVPDAMNENRQPISRQIIMIQNTENKEISPKERRIRSEIRMAWTVSTEAPKVRRPFSNGFKSLQENYPQLKILYPTKLSIKFEIKKKKSFPAIEMLLNDQKKIVFMYSRGYWKICFTKISL